MNAGMSGQLRDSLIIRNLEDLRYSVEYWDYFECNADSLLNICFDPNHLRGYLNKNLIMEIISDHDSTNTLSYVYNNQYYVNVSVYSRYIFPEHDSIWFTLEEFYQNIPLLADIKNMYGYYKISDHDTYSLLHYCQVIDIENESYANRNGIGYLIEGYYLKLYMKKFIRNLKKYIARNSEK